MDGKTKEQVAGLVERLKVEMPLTYKMIQEKAQTMGKPAYLQVRRGIAGMPGCFYARERVRKAGELDRWITAGCGIGLQGLAPEVLEAEFNAHDMVNVIFVLADPVDVHARAQDAAAT
jgi:hypothetical protein